MIDPQTLLEGLIFSGALVGVYVKLNSRIVKVETDSTHLLQMMAQERTDRKEEIERILKETKQDRKIFQDHAKETSDALQELGKAVHGLTVFLKNSLPEAKKKGTRKTLEI
jgi:sensor c-di-GMP phosphodiesterase-like protein